jgi:hypothetical protein
VCRKEIEKKRKETCFFCAVFCEQARENSEFSLLIGFHTPNRMSHTRGRMRDDFYTKRATREQVLAWFAFAMRAKAALAGPHTVNNSDYCADATFVVQRVGFCFCKCQRLLAC